MNLMICKDKQECGAEAAKFGAERIRQAIAEKGECRIILATGASQFEMQEALLKEPGIDWSKVTMFHLDEYVGLPVSHPASFRKYLTERFVEKLPVKMKEVKIYFKTLHMPVKAEKLIIFQFCATLIHHKLLSNNALGHILVWPLPVIPEDITP